MPLSINGPGISRERPGTARSLNFDTNTSHTSAHDTVALVCVIDWSGKDEISFAAVERYALENKRRMTYYRREQNTRSD
jgi:hypothetical protein